MNEFELIQHYFNRSHSDSSVLVGIGDDCAVLHCPQSSDLVVSMDTMLEGRHFPAGSDAKLIAQRALGAALSDLAAMGAKPLWFTLSLSLPEAEQKWLQRFSEGLFELAEQFQILLVGGDTTRGPLTISIQVHGATPNGKAILRSGAAVGDQVFVSGTLGDSAGGLSLITAKDAPRDSEKNPDQELLIDRYFRPIPRISLGQQLLCLASAAIDISDGFLADLGHICSRSDVSAHIDLTAIPLSTPLTALFSAEECRDMALRGGEDFELCFTVPRHSIAKLEALTLAVPVYRIGEIAEGSSIFDIQSGERLDTETGGFKHF